MGVLPRQRTATLECRIRRIVSSSSEVSGTTARAWTSGMRRSPARVRLGGQHVDALQGAGAQQVLGCSAGARRAAAEQAQAYCGQRSGELPGLGEGVLSGSGGPDVQSAGPGPFSGPSLLQVCVSVRIFSERIPQRGPRPPADAATWCEDGPCFLPLIAWPALCLPPTCRGNARGYCSGPP
jgi:hypothetical protein